MKWLLWLSVLMFLAGCGNTTTPDYQTETHELFYAEYAPAKFFDDVHDYEAGLTVIIADQCGFEVPLLPVTLEIFFYQPLSYLGAYFPDDRTVINAAYQCPMSVYGHEVIRHWLYWAGDNRWSISSTGSGNGWEDELVGCLWNEAETYSLNFNEVICDGTLSVPETKLAGSGWMYSVDGVFDTVIKPGD